MGGWHAERRLESHPRRTLLYTTEKHTRLILSQRNKAEETEFDLVWLKGLQLELEQEDPSAHASIV